MSIPLYDDIDLVSVDAEFNTIGLAGPSTATLPTSVPFRVHGGELVEKMNSGSTYLCTDTKGVKFYTRPTGTWA